MSNKLEKRIEQLERAVPVERKPVPLNVAGFWAHLYDGGPPIETPWPVPTFVELRESFGRHFGGNHEHQD